MKILLTGFTPFGELQHNPAQQIVEILGCRSRDPAMGQLITAVLPTEYERASQQIRALMTCEQPDIYLGLGVAVQRSTIQLERVALNLNDASLADNAGVCREGQKIVADGPLAYFSHWPLVTLKEQLHHQGIDITISNHAGTYVCNHVFYWAQHHVHGAHLPTRCGFMHVPLAAPSTGPVPETGFTLMQLSTVVDRCLLLLVDWIHQSP